MRKGSPVNELAAFVAIAERRSFAKAAAQLGVATSTLSHGIRNLEERLGVRLLNRTTRSVAPTEAGERLLAQLRPALRNLDDAVRSIEAFRDRPAGKLRLTVPPPAASMIVAPILARFLSAHPAIALEVSVDGTLRDVVADRFDAGIRMGQLVERDMIAVRLGGPVRLAVVASPDYVARHGRPQRPEDLKTHNCIRMRLPSGGLLPWRFARKGRPFEISPEGTLVVNDRELELRGALDGIGIAHLPGERVAAACAEGRLVPLLEGWLPQMPGFYLYYPSRRQMPGPLRAFIDFATAELGAGAPTRRQRHPTKH